MHFSQVAIDTVSIVQPPHVVSSEDIEAKLSAVYDRLRLPYGRLEMMTGIRERRFWDPDTRPSTVSARAGQKAIEVSGIDPERIGCLIHGAVCRDFMEPATASIVHRLLNLSPSCQMYDLSNACLGVLNGMVMVASLIETGQIEAGLVCTGETAEALHNATIETMLKDRNLNRAGIKSHFASLTIGSAAAAVLLRRKTSESDHTLLGGAIRTDSQANNLCKEDTQNQSEAGPTMATDSEALLHAGVSLARDTWEAAKTELRWDNSTPDRVFTHQVGVAHKRLTFEKLGLDPETDYPTVQVLGNTGSAALPGAFACGIEDGVCQSGDKLALLGIGSGLSSLMLGVEW